MELVYFNISDFLVPLASSPPFTLPCGAAGCHQRKKMLLWFLYVSYVKSEDSYIPKIPQNFKQNPYNPIHGTGIFGCFLKPQNGWFIMEIPIIMDDLGVPPFKETPIFTYIHESLIFMGFKHQKFTNFLPLMNRKKSKPTPWWWTPKSWAYFLWGHDKTYFPGPITM